MGTFVASLVGAFLGAYVLVLTRRPPRAPLTLWTVVVSVGALIAVVALMVALDLGSSDSTAAGAGCGVGILTGQWLAARRAQASG